MRIEFTDAYVWELSPFERENVIFQINTLEPGANREDLPPKIFDAMSAEDRCFELESSVGLDGYIVAREMKVELIE